MNIIFLDIDGVLNYDKFFTDERNILIDNFNKENFKDKKIFDIEDFDLLADRSMLSIDMSKLEMVKELALEINYDIVIISSWRNLEHYNFIEERLKEKGLRVVGRIEDEIEKGYSIIYDRGMGIRKYIATNGVDNYVILDDEVRDYDEVLLKRLIQPNPEIGISEKDIEKVKSICNRKQKLK